MFRKTILIMGACLCASGLFAQSEIVVAFGKMAATPAMETQAEKDGTLCNLNVLLEGLEAVVGSAMTENSPFTMMGGREGWAVYDSLYHKQQLQSEDSIPENVKFGLSLRVSGYTEEVRTRPVASRVQAGLRIVTTVTATILEAGSMK